MAALLKNETGTEISIGGFGKKQSLELRSQKTAAGEEARFELFRFGTDERVASHSQLMEAFTRFADRQLSYGTNKNIIREVFGKSSIGELETGTLGAGGSLDATDILTIGHPAKARNVLNLIEGDVKEIAEQGFLKDNELENLRKARKRLDIYKDVEDFSQQSRMFEKSSSIVTRRDEFSSEVFRYLLERQAILTGDPNKVMQQVTEAVESLFSRGLISAGQKAEAQASALSTILNLSAFETYKFNPREIGSPGEGFGNVLANPLNRFKRSRELLSQNASVLDPHITGTIDTTSKRGLQRITGIAPIFKKNLGMGKYVEEPVGGAFHGQSTRSGQGFTYVPTFGTALKRNPKATLLSAAGIKTYGNEEGFSLASVPMSHG
jgi:hypothetical protein